VARAAVAGLITDQEVQAGKLHIVTTVTGYASRCYRVLLPATAVPAYQIVFLRGRVTLPAYIYHLTVAGQSGSMTTVTSRAGRGLRVPIYHQSTSVNALSIQLELVGGNAIGLHTLFVGMALGAGSWQFPWMDARRGICRILDVVAAMAIIASGHVLIPLGQKLPVHAFPVLAHLVNRQPIRGHPLTIGVTGAAQIRDGRSVGYADVTGLR
jgi:hypothetical protein